MLATDDLAASALGFAGEGWLNAHALLHGLRRRAMADGAVDLKAEVVALQPGGAE